ncbi:MAG TPA: cytochrome c peroxidase [Thiobacillus sp.]|nr:cytochrome c peroxidase [Thiobacillus sp.]
MKARMLERTVLTGLFLWVGMAVAVDLPGPVSDADFYASGVHDPKKVALGQALFFDKIMSGNKNISCATCHSPLLNSGDGLSLGVGQRGQYLGPMRITDTPAGRITSRIGRNAPPLFNLGAKEFIRLNWQGRHEVRANGSLNLPSAQFTPAGLDNVLAGQSLFPLLNTHEMLGLQGENEIVAAAPLGTPPGPALFPWSWEALMNRLRAVPEYVEMFKAAYSDVESPETMNIKHYANAVAAFQTVAFRADNSPFDRYLRGETDALSEAQVRGMDLFYNKANCASCHSGKFQTDHNFYAIAMPQFGPGVKSSTTRKQEDVGRREMVANDAEKYKFRTPPLRNIALTAPYGHTGAYKTLEGVIRHHLDPVNSFLNWDRSQVSMPSRSDLDALDFLIMDDPVFRQPIINANQLAPSTLTDEEIKDLIDFLQSLTDVASLDLNGLIPRSVPSGLPVGD